TLKLTPAGVTVAPSTALRRSVSMPALLKGRSPSDERLRLGDDAVGLEAELALQLLERRRRAERLHADDAARGSNVALPAERRALLDREPRRHGRRQHTVAVRLRL